MESTAHSPIPRCEAGAAVARRGCLLNQRCGCLFKSASTHHPLGDSQSDLSFEPDLRIVLLQERLCQASSSDRTHVQAIRIVALPVIEKAVIDVLVCRTDVLVTARHNVGLPNVARILDVNADLQIVDGVDGEIRLEGRVDVSSIPDESTAHSPSARCEAGAAVSRRGCLLNQRCGCLFKSASTHHPLGDTQSDLSFEPDLRIVLLQECLCQASSSDRTHVQAIRIVALPVIEPAVIDVLVCRTDVLVTAWHQVRLPNVARILQVHADLQIVDGVDGEIRLEGRVDVSSIPDESTAHSPSPRCEAGAAVSRRGCLLNQRCGRLFKSASTHHPLGDTQSDLSFEPDLRIVLLQECLCQASSSDRTHVQAIRIVALPVIEPAVIDVLVCRTDVLVTTRHQVRLPNVARILQVHAD